MHSVPGKALFVAPRRALPSAPVSARVARKGTAPSASARGTSGTLRTRDFAFQTKTRNMATAVEGKAHAHKGPANQDDSEDDGDEDDVRVLPPSFPLEPLVIPESQDSSDAPP